jgi:hypothetical protein
MTKYEAAVISAYTGIVFCDFPSIHEYIEKILDRPVFTHELARESVVKEIKDASKADFFEIVNNLT